MVFKNNPYSPAKLTFKEHVIETLKVFGIFLLINSFGIANFQVPTGSMENEIMAGDFLIVNKFSYGGTTPRTIPFTDIKIPNFKFPALVDIEKGDPIVFEFPGYRDEVEANPFAYYLKRCIAIAGDTLEIVNGKIYVNKILQEEPRNIQFYDFKKSKEEIDPRIFPTGKLFNDRFYGPIRIPKKGDRILLSQENINEWYIFILREKNTSEIVDGKILINGKEENTYEVKQDYVFAMGDNRDNSLDSRFWGFVPKDEIIGTPLFVLFSVDQNISWNNVFEKIRFNRIGNLVK